MTDEATTPVETPEEGEATPVETPVTEGEATPVEETPEVPAA